MKKRHMLLSCLDWLWASDVALSALLVFLLIQAFVIYPVGEAGHMKLLSGIFFSLILITGGIAVSTNRFLGTLALLCGLFTFIFLWAWYLHVNETLVYMAAYVAMADLVLLTLLILSQTLREGPTTSHRIRGAVAAYLLLGLIWSWVYYAIALHRPGAFTGLEALSQRESEALYTHFQYFSFTVLTTVGFGDIVPVDPIARMAANLEGVTGQLFLAILIARLVSLQVQSKQKTS